MGWVSKGGRQGVCVKQLARAWHRIELEQKQNYLIGFSGVDTVPTAAPATAAPASSPTP